ncbi:MAG: DUF2721 domain-containing protein [Chlorobi bacterium]|nr:DUF2721 domain-containing protein [Chlorobiota bacterium]
MNNIELWLTPLLLLPGVALLILSTSSRYERIHDEIHHLEHSKEEEKEIASNLFYRAKLFKNALNNLYISVALFSTAGLLGGIVSVWTPDYHWVVTILSGVGILTLLISAALLIIESRMSLEIIKLHFKNILNEEENKP